MPQLSPEALSDLIGLIYQGPLEQVPWSSSLRWLTHNLDFSWAVLVLRPASHSLPSLIIQAHEQEVGVSKADYIFLQRYASDPFTELPLNQITTPEEMLGEEWWHSHPFFKEYLQPNDIHYEMGADFCVERSRCRLRICRPLRSGPYTAEERLTCQMLVPHFRRAVELHAKLYITDAERMLYAGSFDHLRIGTIVLDELGAVLTMSEAAREMLSQQEGLAIESGTLRVHCKRAAVGVEKAIAQAVIAPAETPLIKALSIKDSSRRCELHMLVKSIPRLQGVEAQRRPAAAIFIRDARHHFEPSPEVLRMLFDFTVAEAHFAGLLAAGLSMEEAGKQLGITRNTCKSRLRAIFAKTGVTRQAALVGVLHDTLASL
jgi:DNA-binding CsgD family transcriptional regulator